MNKNTYKKIRVAVSMFIAILVSISVSLEIPFLALFAVLTGMLFMFLARSKTKIFVDEREKIIRDKASNLAYSIFTPLIGLGSFFILTFYQHNPTLFIVGQVMSYLTLLILALYSISYYFISKRYGGSDSE